MSKIKNFTIMNHDGEQVSLIDFEGKNIWLAFYRYAGCPLCNLHINRILNRYDEIKTSNLIFLPVFQSPVSVVKKHVASKDLPFKILCDPNEELYKLFNVRSSLSGFLSLSVITKSFEAIKNGYLPGKAEGSIGRLPSEFLLNKNLEIAFRYDGSDIGDHPSIDLIISEANRMEFK